MHCRLTVCVCVSVCERQQRGNQIRSILDSEAQVPLNFQKWFQVFWNTIQHEEDKQSKNKESTFALHCYKREVIQIIFLKFVWGDLLVWQHLN